MNNLSVFSQALLANDNYLIVAHENPDPDSIGSMLGLYHCLTALGKKCTMMSSDSLPRFSWPGMNLIQPYHNLEVENAIVLDCDPQRTGEIIKLVDRAKLSFNIDHHEGNPKTSDYNLVDSSQAATATLVYKLCCELGVEFSYEIALPLYGGIVGDTGGFRHANTNQEVFEISAQLMQYGIKPDVVAREIFASKSIDFVRFLGYALSKLQSRFDGKLVWLSISYKEFEDFKIAPEKADTLIEHIRIIDGNEISILLREVEPEKVRIGFRSNAVNIHQLAVHFGGGGHILASGARMEGSLAEVEKQVTTVASQLLEGEFDERSN